MAYVLHCDVQYSRRLFLHVILDETDRAVWTGKRLEQAMEWLIEQGVTSVVIDGERANYGVSFAKIETPIPEIKD